MVSFKVDAEGKAKIQGTEDMEEYPIVAKVKGTGKGGGISVQVSGADSTPIAAKVLGDASDPIIIAPISIVPDIKSAADTLNIKSLMASLERMAQGLRVEVSNKDAPISIALGKIPVDVTISVFSPKQEPVFRIDITGTLGGE